MRASKPTTLGKQPLKGKGGLEKKSRPSNAHGGKRPGAGRKKKVESADAKKQPTTRKSARGRKSTYSIDEAKKICAWIAAGKSLLSYCKQGGAPSLATVYEWRIIYPELSEMYARAREDQADALADELLDIADNSTLDHNDRRIKIDTRKWIASKLKPRTYGDKVHNEVSGELSFAQIIVSRYRPPA